MSKYIILLVASLTTWTVKANPLIVQPRFTSSFRFESTDIWNVDIQFHGSGAVNIYLQASVTYKGAPVVTARSGIFQIQPGVQSFTGVTLTTTNLQFKSRAIADIESLTGSYPAGNYTTCYSAYCVTADCDGLGANALDNETPQCFDFVVEPPTPLLLATPEDKAELEWPRPTFNWIPPMPLSSVSGFHYMYTLVERQKDQTCNDAIVRNRPLFQQSAIEIPVQPYPAELNDLDTGKNYCWKVDGLVSEIPVAQSEVWEFKLKIPEKVVRKRVAILPVKNLGNELYTVQQGDTLVLSFQEEVLTEQVGLVLKITDEGRKSVIMESVALDQVNHKWYELICDDIKVTEPGHYYLLELSSVNGDRWLARVKLID